MLERVALPRPCAVYSRARPRRVAFLVSAEETPPELLDDIFTFNYGHWGGRYNPIIPLIGGTITESFWKLLAFADTDLVYSYTPLPDDLSRRIWNEIHPWRIDNHPDQRGANPPSYYPRIGREQVDTNAVWPILCQHQGIGAKPKLLTSGAAWNWPDRRRVLRNFGLIEENMALKPYPETQERISIQNDWTEARLYAELGTYQPVIFPFAASSSMTPFPEVEGFDLHRYCLVIGDDLPGWLYLWNRGLFFSNGSEWHTLCVPVDAVDNDNFVNCLRSFLQHRTRRAGNNPAHIDLVSFTVSQEELQTVSDRLFHGLDLIPRRHVLQPTEFPGFEKRDDPYPEFRWPAFYFGLDRTTRQQVSFSKSLLRIPSSEVPLEHGCWVMELRVEHAPQHKFYSNETLWFKVPRSREMAQLFIRNRSARVSADYSICAEMSREGFFELNIPDDYAVLVTAIRVGLEAGQGEPKYKHYRIWDKGRYANGVLSLFGGLQQAGGFFEHSFWRGMAERLSKRERASDELVLETIRNKLSKHSANLAVQLSGGREEAIGSFARYTLNLARQQQMSDEDITFAELNTIFQEQRESFIDAQSGFRTDNSPEAVEADKKAAAEDLEGTLQGLTEGGIFLQGVRMRCRNCGSNYWKEVSEVRQNDRCPGCGAAVSVSVEAPWRYRLNTLVRNSVAFHGVVPVILTLQGVRSNLSRDSFFFVPGLAFFEKYEDVKPAAELDIVCIADARLIVGEVKTSPSEFSSSELTKLVNLARSVRADIAIIGAYRDDNGEMQRKREILQQMLAGTAISTEVVVPSPYAFEPTPHS